MSGPPAALLCAYARTAYTVAEGRAVARTGRRSPSVDALLQRLGSRQGGFVTAWNPLSRRMPRGWNDRALERLRAASRRLPRAEGWGIGRSWSEAHLLLGADPRRVLVLARRFRQHAIVAVRAGAPARVVHAHGAPMPIAMPRPRDR